MSHYIHDLPGRLRVKSRALKNRDGTADRAIAALQAVRGVRVTEVNAVTGSVLVRYDPAAVNASRLLDVLKEHGIIGPAVPATRPPAPVAWFNPYEDRLQGWADRVEPRLVEDLAKRLARVLFETILERLFHRAAVAVVAALI